MFDSPRRDGTCVTMARGSRPTRHRWTAVAAGPRRSYSGPTSDRAAAEPGYCTEPTTACAASSRSPATQPRRQARRLERRGDPARCLQWSTSRCARHSATRLVLLDRARCRDPENDCAGATHANKLTGRPEMAARAARCRPPSSRATFRTTRPRSTPPTRAARPCQNWRRRRRCSAPWPPRARVSTPVHGDVARRVGAPCLPSRLRARATLGRAALRSTASEAGGVAVVYTIVVAPDARLESASRRPPRSNSICGPSTPMFKAVPGRTSPYTWRVTRQRARHSSSFSAPSITSKAEDSRTVNHCWRCDVRKMYTRTRWPRAFQPPSRVARRPREHGSRT